MTSEMPLSFEARDRLRVIVNRTTELTPLKAVATKAIALAEDERTAAMDLATVITSDQALTSKLLRLSNSAYYGYARRISNVREAVILLGMRTVRSVAIASGIIDSLKPPEGGPFDQDLFWAHGVCVGLVAEAVARETKVARPEDAFTAGVVHDVGKLAMMLCEPQMFADVIDLAITEQKPYREAEMRVFGVGHQYVGGRLAQRWKFPDTLAASIRDHHPQKPVAMIETLSDVITVSNLLCNREGLACGFDWTGVPERKAIDAVPPRVENAINRVYGGMKPLQEKAQAFLRHVTTRTPRWYGLHGMAQDPPEDADAQVHVA